MSVPPPAPRRLAIIAAFAALYIIWGSTYLGILFAIESIPPLLMAGVRFFLAGLIMYGIALWQGAPKSSFAEWRTALLVGACLLFFGNGSVTIAEQWVPSGLASLLVATVPIYIALLAWLTGSAPRPRPFAFLGLAGGFVGVGVLVGPAITAPPVAGSHHVGLGMLILLFGSLMWSIGSLYSRRARSSSSPFLSSAQTMLCGGGLMMIAGLVHGEARHFHFSQVTAVSLGAFIYLVLIGAVVGYTAYIWLLRHCDPSKVATYAYVNPVVAVLLGSFFAGETLTLRTAVAAAIIIGSVAVVINAQQDRKKNARPLIPMVAEMK
ncbi:MAG: EamA family transporter [Chthoniobacterales bacterium]|nr:EamA family transporter [Chthoniobacterales bacterium]